MGIFAYPTCQFQKNYIVKTGKWGMQIFPIVVCQYISPHLLHPGMACILWYADMACALWQMLCACAGKLETNQWFGMAKAVGKQFSNLIL